MGIQSDNTERIFNADNCSGMFNENKLECIQCPIKNICKRKATAVKNEIIEEIAYNKLFSSGNSFQK